MTPISARSRMSAMVSGTMESKSSWASSGVRTGVFPLVTTCFGPRTAAAGFILMTWPDHEVVEEHPNRREVLFNARHIKRLPHLLYIRGDEHGLDLVECDVVIFAPVEEPAYRVGVRDAACYGSECWP